MKRLVILWQRFGPYHFARVRGASEVLGKSGWEVTGCEVAGKDHYPWQQTLDQTVDRQTLFPDRTYEQISPRQIRGETQRFLNSISPDAVAINGWSVSESQAALAWCKRRDRPAILMSETFEASGNWLKELVKKWRVRWYSGAIVGGKLHAEYIERLGMPQERIRIGYDVIDNHHFSDRRSTPDVSELIPGVRRKSYFFANTRFIPRKRIDTLLYAYAAYRHELPANPECADWQLVISGSGEMQAEWTALAVRLRISEFVHWPGFLQYDQLPIVYQNASAFVHPASREPWGLVVNEAAAAGLPLLVADKVGAVCELLNDGENGFAFRATDAESLADCLKRIASMKNADRELMGNASASRVAAFGPVRFGTALADLLGFAD